MPELSHIDPASAALLVMDYQVDTLTKFMTAAQSADAIACVPDLIAMARDAGMMVLHVVVAFRPGHPEVNPRNPVFGALKATGMAVAGSEGAAIHPAAAAREGEPIVVKHRISPFVGTDLETLLRANGVDTLVLGGSTPAASCCRPFATPAIWIIGWSSSAIAAPIQMQRCIRCCSTSSSRSRRPSSPRRSSPAPSLAGLHERMRAIDPEKHRHSLSNPFALRFDPRRSTSAGSACMRLHSREALQTTRDQIGRSVFDKRVLARAPGRCRDAGRADHVDERAQRGGNLSPPGIIEEQSIERGRPVFQHAD
jgi:Isochorismatase family